MNPTELKNLSLEITTLLRNERGKTMESANNITLDRILRHCNTLTGRNDGIVDLNDFLYNQVLDLINQGETTRFGHVTQPIHQRVLESLGLT